jgi:hypothetical protein
MLPDHLLRTATGFSHSEETILGLLPATPQECSKEGDRIEVSMEAAYEERSFSIRSRPGSCESSTVAEKEWVRGGGNWVHLKSSR